MKKITLTSILVLCMICPAMADIAKEATSATCDSSTIGTTTGPANLQADWTANTLHLDWYSEDSKLTVGSTSATCTYDGAITLPSTPQVPTGYTFGGWKVRAAAQAQTTFDLSGLDPTLSSEGGYGYITLNNSIRYNETVYGLTSPGDWAVEFNYGTIKGVASCNATSAAAQYQTGNPETNESGQYCWFRVTDIDRNKNGQYQSVSSDWVLYADAGSENACISSCLSYGLEYGIRGSSSNFRRALYGVTE